MSAGWAAFWMLACWCFGGLCCFFVLGVAFATSGACVFWDGCSECRASHASAPQAPAKESP